MLNSLPVKLLLGIGLGFLSGLGVGGGSLLVLWLTVVMDTPPETARSINLLFFLPAAMIALHFRKKQGLLQWKPLLPAIVSGCVTAAAGTCLAAALDTGLLKKGFGILLIITGIRELTHKKE
jgi:uncharacterized membrane protein YfcA